MGTTTVEAPAPKSVDWQAAIWRGVRGFFGTLIAIVVASFATASAGLGAVPVNFADLRHTLQALILAFILGFLNALFKAIRDKWGDPTGAGVINKLPV